jgi:hypothetical protein
MIFSTISTAELVFFNCRDAAMRVTPVGVAYANVGFPDGLAHQDRGRKERKRRILASPERIAQPIILKTIFRTLE